MCQSKQSSNLTWLKIDKSGGNGTEFLIYPTISKYALIETFLQQNTLYQSQLIIYNLDSLDFAIYKCVNSLNQSAQVNMTLSSSSACVIIPVCQCINATRVNCSGRDLVNLDELLFTANPTLLAQVEWLDLSHNKLVYITSEMFKKFVNLAYLDLSFNAINAIDSYAFNALSNLNVSLHLSHNQLDAIYAQTFAGLSNLTRLYLSSNQVKIIEDNSFLSLFKLELLELSSNKLTAIQASTLNGLESLQTLSLQSNRIASFDVNSLSNLTNLKVLNLNGNVFDSTYYLTSCKGKFYLKSLFTKHFLTFNLKRS